MEIKKFKEFNDLLNKYCIKINNKEELDMVLQLYLIYNINWCSGHRADEISFNRSYPFYIHYNYYNNNEIATNDTPLLKEIAIDELKKFMKRKRKTNREIDPYDEEDWGWIDDD